MKALVDFLEECKTISEFCSAQNIQWKFISERAPHFGGLWEAAVKIHLKRVIAATKLTFKEFSTVLTQVEACLNSRPLTPLHHDDDVIEALTPGRFSDRKAPGISARPMYLLSFSLPTPSLASLSVHSSSFLATMVN